PRGERPRHPRAAPLAVVAGRRPARDAELGLSLRPGARLPRRPAGRLRRRPVPPPVPRLRPAGALVDQPAVRLRRREGPRVQGSRMNALSWRWEETPGLLGSRALELSVLVPLAGAAWVALKRKNPEAAARRCLAVTALTLLCAVAAWLRFHFV